jgi:hypothetical protein
VVQVRALADTGPTHHGAASAAAAGGGGESFLRVHWVAVPEALRARRVIGVSSILVLGGSGDYFAVAVTTLLL